MKMYLDNFTLPGSFLIHNRLFVCLLLFLSKGFYCEEEIRPLEISSSVKCYGEHGPYTQFCTFRKVCYKNKTVLYFGAPPKDMELPLSIYTGVGRIRRNSAAILDVEFDSNPQEWFDFNNTVVETKSYVFSQTFNNYYFTLYTLFSLYETLKVTLPYYPTTDYRDYISLFLSDERVIKPSIPELYSIYSKETVGKLTNADKKNKSVCFDNVTVGLERNAILGEEYWYDNLLDENSKNKPVRNWRSYFNQYIHYVEGKKTDKYYRASVFDLEKGRITKILTEFRDYSLKKLGLYVSTVPEYKVVITFISREKKRRILNVEEIKSFISMRWEDNIHIQEYNLEDYTLSEQISIMRNTSILIGIHGAGLMNAMWLRDHAEVIELFPYKYYKPTYELVCDLLSLKRHVWINKIVDNTVFNWKRVPKDLSFEDKELIVNTTRHPEVSDSDLKNLFKNQDTYIDIAQFMGIINPIISKMVKLN